MTRFTHAEMRAFSLPPDNSVEEPVSSPVHLRANLSPPENSLHTTNRLKPQNRDDLGLVGDKFHRRFDFELGFISSRETANCNIKHSPSDCGSAFTDEDSGCQVYFSANSSRIETKARMERAYSVSTLDSPSVKSFGNRDEFLTAMTEDLAEWMSRIHPEIATDLYLDNFFDKISDGVILCYHATKLHRLLEQEFSISSGTADRCLRSIQVGGKVPTLPINPPQFQTRSFTSVGPAGFSFWARDNVANFIHWCRDMKLSDSILFETEDLVSRKNIHSVVVCLLELARLGGCVGMEVPEIIYLEKEIDDEIALQERVLTSGCEGDSFDSPDLEWTGNTPDRITNNNAANDFVEADRKGFSNTVIDPTSVSKSQQASITSSASRLKGPKLKPEKKDFNRQEGCPVKKQEEEEEEKEGFLKRPRYNRPVIDMRTLDEIVREKLSQCTCDQTFPMIRLSEGRYLFGDKSVQIFIRILRNHVMVRVGGGWDTLDHFLQRYDECRKVQHPDSLKRNTLSFNKRQSQPVNTASIWTEPRSPLEETRLLVTKKGKEVVCTHSEVIFPKQSTCNATQHFSQVVTPVSLRHQEITPSSTGSCIEDMHQDPTVNEITQTSDFTSLPLVSPNTSSARTTNLEDKVDEVEAQKETEITGCLCPTDGREYCLPTPVIDQVTSGFEQEINPRMPKSTSYITPKHSAPNRTPQKFKYQRAVPSSKRSFNSPDISKGCPQRASSIHNLSSTQNSRGSYLDRFSTSSISLNDASASGLAMKSSKVPVNRPTLLATTKRANSTSNLALSPLSPKSSTSTGPQQRNVFERLYSGSDTRRLTLPNLLSPPSTPIKNQSLQPRYAKAPAIRQYKPCAVIKRSPKPIGLQQETKLPDVPQTTSHTLGSIPTQRSSVARMPAEGSRIPRPTKTFTASVAVRSQSIGSCLNVNSGSVPHSTRQQETPYL